MGIKSNINKNVNIFFLYPKINCLVYSLHFETTGLAEINELPNH